MRESDTAARLARQLAASVEGPLRYGEVDVTLATSYGVAVAFDDGAGTARRKVRPGKHLASSQEIWYTEQPISRAREAEGRRRRVLRRSRKRNPGATPTAPQRRGCVRSGGFAPHNTGGFRVAVGHRAERFHRSEGLGEPRDED